jgi:glycosyltransferase involved in cell wall biosynthesis
MRYHPDGPAVMLGESTSFFPAQLASCWRSKGLDVAVVTHNPEGPSALPDGTRIIRSSDQQTRLNRSVNYRLLHPILRGLEKTVPRFKKRFSRITGVSAESELRLPYFATYVTNAWPTAQAALSLQPRFVLGHEVTTYGLATALCRGVPRILFPWGGDVFTYAESSPYHLALTRFALRAVDLIVPSATTAAQHICQRFGISTEKVQAISWGVDRQLFKRPDVDRRLALRRQWKIDPAATVFLNARRFHPAWGGNVALEAFMQLASEYPNTHFIFLGGHGSERFLEPARVRLAGAGLLPRFTLLDGNIPLEACADLMSLSDVFLSLLGLGDMRSISVLQAAATGGVPVISDLPEYREMERNGFAALFVQPDSIADVLQAARFCLENPDERENLVANNQVYIEKHEDYPKQMDKLLSLIDGVCTKYAGR